MSRWIWVALLTACNEPKEQPSPTNTTTTPASHTTMPTHNECLPNNERISDEACFNVIAFLGKPPNQSFYKVSTPPPDPDPRLTDPDYMWLNEEIKSCTCSCCHSSTLDGPGVYHWDLDFDGYWLDSASEWTLEVMKGDIFQEGQKIPIADEARVRSIIDRELERRDRAAQRQ